MTDNRNTGLRHVPDSVRESRSRNSKLSQQKMKTKRRVIGFKDSQSPSYHDSYNCRKDFTTPKRRPRIRFNGCYSGDSPNETESLQDIIWDPNSPTQNFNGKGVNGKVIEISEIVNRIAPKVERPNEGDSVLQWIGDSSIPCTPEIRQPRVRRISARQSNVEDLMKLAKQFDINMTRQDKEKQQNITENLNKLNKAQSDGMTRAKLASIPVTSGKVTSCLSQARREEEELQALFDGPTQHLSGRLSPPSANCTPESRTNPVVAELGSSSAIIKNAPVDTPKKTEVDFDDDWENDDLLNDSFVLEMTQNPVPLNTALKQNIAQNECSFRNCIFVTKTNSSVSNGRDVCLQIQQSTSKSSTFTSKLPEGQLSIGSTLRQPLASAQGQTTEKLLRTSLVEQEKQPAQSSQGKKQEELVRATKDCRGSGQTSNFDGVSKEDLKSLLDSDGLWDDDDDLLYQACDDVEKISASQEQQGHSMDFTKLAHNTSKAPSSTGIIYSQTMGINGKSQIGEPTKSTRAFARSNSVPCSSGSSEFKQDYGVLPTTEGSSSAFGSVIPYHYKQAQNKLTHVKSALGPKPSSVRVTDTSQKIMPQSTRVGNASNSHHFTFKRHLSDSVTLTNKVFVSSNTTVKCSAAEIEKKKQEAIARRRLRIQASQKHGGPT